MTSLPSLLLLGTCSEHHGRSGRPADTLTSPHLTPVPTPAHPTPRAIRVRRSPR